MKIFRTLVTEKKKKGQTETPKTRPILIAAENIADAKEQLEVYWGKAQYKWQRPNMVADFNPK